MDQRANRQELHTVAIETIDQQIDIGNKHASSIPVPSFEVSTKNQDRIALVRPTIKRYIILVLFCINGGNKTFQWIQIPAATTKASIFYGVDNYAINATSTIFMWSFIVLSWPACYTIDRLGIRKAVIIASFGTAIGSIVKCFSCYQGGIWLLMLAQVLIALSEQLIYSVPSRLASVWFPDHQVSRAVAMCVLGNQIGTAVGFQIPQMFLNEAETVEEIGAGLHRLFILTMIISCVAFILDYFLFEEEPELAPGYARLKQRELERTRSKNRSSLRAEMGTLFSQIWQLLINKHLVMLVLSYGIRFSIGDVIATLLNQMIKPLWPDSDLLIGNIGFMMTAGGILGLPLWGHYLDKSHCYKMFNIMSSLATIISLVIFVYVLIYLRMNVTIYLVASLFGFFQIGSLVASLELAVELTYPAPELITSSLMNISGPLFGTIFVFLGSYIVDNCNPLAINAFYLVCLLVALILSLCSRETLNRQDMIKKGTE